MSEKKLDQTSRRYAAKIRNAGRRAARAAEKELALTPEGKALNEEARKLIQSICKEKGASFGYIGNCNSLFDDRGWKIEHGDFQTERVETWELFKLLQPLRVFCKETYGDSE